MNQHKLWALSVHNPHARHLCTSAKKAKEEEEAATAATSKFDLPEDDMPPLDNVPIKTVENRVWPKVGTNFKQLRPGEWFVCHCTQTWSPRKDWWDVLEAARSEYPDHFAMSKESVYKKSVYAQCPKGQLCGLLRLHSIVPLTEELKKDHPFATGPMCWMIDDMIPIPKELRESVGTVRGQQRLWKLDPDVERRLLSDYVAPREAAYELRNGIEEFWYSKERNAWIETRDSDVCCKVYVRRATRTHPHSSTPSQCLDLATWSLDERLQNKGIFTMLTSYFAKKMQGQAALVYVENCNPELCRHFETRSRCEGRWIESTISPTSFFAPMSSKKRKHQKRTSVSE